MGMSSIYETLKAVCESFRADIMAIFSAAERPVTTPDMYGIKMAKKPKRNRAKVYSYMPCVKKNLPYQRRNY